MHEHPCAHPTANALHTERIPLALFASSALSLAFVLARVTLTGRMSYVFLVWNLFLAWLPYVLARLIARRARRNAASSELLALGVVFIGFLPNAPYLVTDLIHLRGQTSVPYWFDTLMLASFGWSGLVLGVASVRLTAAIIRRRTSSVVSDAYVGIASVLVAFGIYLGRFLRFNTWDAAAHPFTLARSVAAPVIHPVHYAGAWLFTAAFAAFFLASYACFTRRPDWA